MIIVIRFDTEYLPEKRYQISEIIRKNKFSSSLASSVAIDGKSYAELIIGDSKPVLIEQESIKYNTKLGNAITWYYFKDDVYQSQKDFDTVVASEKDVPGLLWLTKLSLK